MNLSQVGILINQYNPQDEVDRVEADVVSELNHRRSLHRLSPLTDLEKADLNLAIVKAIKETFKRVNNIYLAGLGLNTISEASASSDAEPDIASAQGKEETLNTPLPPATGGG